MILEGNYLLKFLVPFSKSSQEFPLIFKSLLSLVDEINVPPPINPDRLSSFDKLDSLLSIALTVFDLADVNP